MRGRTNPPGPRYLTPFGVGREMRRDPLGYVVGLWRDYGDVVRVRMGPLVSYMFYHPEAVRHVLQENNQNYVKGPIIGRVKVLLGEGLFTSEGAFWRRQRRLAQPAFHKERIASFVDTMVACTAERLDRWEPAARRGDAVDLAAEMSELALTIVGRTLFGSDLSHEAPSAGRALRTALQLTADRALRWVVPPMWVPTRDNRALRSARRTLDAVVYDVIASRRRAAEPGDDLLGLLMSARDEDTGEGMTAQQLRDEVMTFFLAGHETTATALAWTWHLLGRHPEVAERLRAEVAGALGDRPPTFGDVPRLQYARQVVEEAMRLYPPVWAVGRQAVGPDRVQGWDLPAGTLVSLPNVVTHRHPDFWPDPDRFDPDRFAPEAVKTRPRFAYFPFSGGPRLCIGETFALVEAQVILAMTMQRYRVSLVDERPAEIEATLTLRPRGGLPVRVAPARVADAARRAG